MTTIVIDRYKLMHWLNARKVTPAMAAGRAKLPLESVAALLSSSAEIGTDEVRRLANALHIPTQFLVAEEPVPSVIHATKADVEATCRPIHRDGIHFYNYYTLPSPNGMICPVILDILCPSDRLPKQNNGHLEPAITINIGPGDINGRWDGRNVQGLNNDTWSVMRHNHGAESWILGDSYVEPSWCPHTYSLAQERPAQILSYTIKTQLDAFAARTNTWSEDSFAALLGAYDGKPFPSAALATCMDRRGFSVASLSKASRIGSISLTAFLDGDQGALTLDELKCIGGILACDWRVLIAPVRNHDSVGKTWGSIDDSIASIRPFRSYTVASMAMGSHVPDLIGLFVKVDKPEGQATLDLLEPSATHYVVSGGSLTLHWLDADGSVKRVSLGMRDALWIGSYVRHAFSGSGSLVKLGNGEGVSTLDQFELSNTFELADTLRRGRRDEKTWGYDNDEGENL